MRSQGKIRSKIESKITLHGNAIVNNGHTTLYYLANMYNYSMYTPDSISMQLTSLYNMLTNIESQFKGVKFSIFRYDDVVSPEGYVSSLVDTIRLWNESFVPSDDFLNNVKYTSSQFCFIAINIDDKNAVDLNSMNLMDAAKEVVNDFLNAVSSSKQQDINVEKVEAINKQILDLSQGILKPCPERTLMTYYIKRVFPSYNVVVRDSMYDTTKVVLAYLQQEYVPYFNYFEMKNSGIEYFGATPRVTYGSIIDIIEMPDDIDSEMWSMCVDGLVCNLKTLSKDKARLKFMRTRSDIEYEEATSNQVGGDKYAMELADYSDLAEAGIAAVSLGRKIVEGDVHILVLADSVEELNTRRANLISALKNQDVIATFNPRQAETYVKSFIKLRPEEYDFLMDLRYPLAWKLDSGTQIGDFDSGMQSPIIGQTATKSEATNISQ